MPEENATARLFSMRPMMASRASQVGVPSSREYARSVPRTKFDAGTGGWLRGAPGRRSRPAATRRVSTDAACERLTTLMRSADSTLAPLFSFGFCLSRSQRGARPTAAPEQVSSCHGPEQGCTTCEGAAVPAAGRVNLSKAPAAGLAAVRLLAAALRRGDVHVKTQSCVVNDLLQSELHELLLAVPKGPCELCCPGRSHALATLLDVAEVRSRNPEALRHFGLGPAFALTDRCQQTMQREGTTCHLLEEANCSALSPSSHGD